ncbi:iron-containing alcohol dehydrogenase [Mitsuokella jalaludinii]|uniref:iron-containing alcohol dehydrogenase n=1 Tax=Mitsuokella jalaludinii TaxID=187979 RepID=UPI003F9BB54E
MRSLEGVAPTKHHAVKTIAVPTTAGTAAEVTINYVITDPEKVRKFVCVDEHDIPAYAVIDPDMMSSMPKGLTASTGIDALTHAIEGYTTKGAWEMTDMMHIEAIRLIAENLRQAVENDRRGVPAWRSAAIDAVKKLSADVGIPATLDQVKELFRKIMA